MIRGPWVAAAERVFTLSQIYFARADGHKAKPPAKSSLSNKLRRSSSLLTTVRAPAFSSNGSANVTSNQILWRATILSAYR